MKIAVFSDVHGNIYSLMTAFEDMDMEKVDMTICLGDLVGYGPHPNEVIALIRRREIPCIKGNYDTSVVDGDFTYIRDNPVNSFILPWTCEELRESNKYFLDSLPEYLTYDFNGVKFRFTHGSPNSISEYLYADGENTKKVMENLKEDVLVCAHTHIPTLKKFNDKTLINVGSVGKPKIGRPNLTYCIINIDENKNIDVKFKELEYEFHKIVKDAKMLNFPSQLINSYETGSE